MGFAAPQKPAAKAQLFCVKKQSCEQFFVFFPFCEMQIEARNWHSFVARKLKRLTKRTQSSQNNETLNNNKAQTDCQLRNSLLVFGFVSVLLFARNAAQKAELLLPILLLLLLVCSKLLQFFAKLKTQTRK